MKHALRNRVARLAMFACLVGAVGLIGWLLGTAQQEARAQAKPVHRLALHVSENDGDKMTMVLNNASNAASAWGEKGESYAIEIVAIGPGLHMLREDTSPVKARIKSMAESTPGLVFASCENTRSGMKRREGKEIPLIAQAKPVPSGIVRLAELQEQGWTYARP